MRVRFPPPVAGNPYVLLLEDLYYPFCLSLLLLLIWSHKLLRLSVLTPI